LFNNNDWYWDNNILLSQELKEISNFTTNFQDNGVIIKLNNSFSLATATNTASLDFICKIRSKVLSSQALIIGYKSSRPGLFFPPNQNA
jgi:hypothetical protein